MMRQLTAIATLLLAFALRGYGATWYVDEDVTGTSSNAGTSWANAWTNFTSVVWGGSGVKAGDTLYISGGVYTDRLNIGASGTAANPITIQKSLESGHEDETLMTSTNGRISINSNDYIIISGSNGLAFNHTVTNAATTTNLAQYIGWRIQQTNENTTAILGQNCEGVKIQWLNIDGSMDGTNFGRPGGNSGISFNGNDLTGTNIIQYCYIHDVGQDGIGGNNSPRTNYTELIIRYNYITRLGDDGIEFSGGSWIYRNRIQETTGQHGHPDAIQCPHDWWRIEENIIGDFNTGLIYGGTRHYTNQYFYAINNLMYMDKTNATQHPIQAINMDQTLLEYGAQTNYYFSDINISGNTIVDCGGGISFANRFAILDGSNGQPYTNWLNISNLVIENNVFRGASNATSIGFNMRGVGKEGIIYLDTPRINYNVVSGNPAIRQVYFNGTYYSNIVTYTAATGHGTNNSTNLPSFMNYAAGDYSPGDSDTMLIAAGKDLSALYTTDLNANSRSAPYDIGAYKYSPTYVETNLLVYMTFEDDFESAGYITDYSGFNHHGLRWGVSTNAAQYFPIRTNSPKVGSYSAHFNPDYDVKPYPSDTNFWSGRYAGITNVNPRITNMPLATVMVWAQYDSLTNGQSSTSDHNATFVDTGYGIRGAWHFGRYYSTSIGNTRLLINTNAGSIASAPQLVWNNATYTNDTWNHYAFTFDSTDNTNVIVKLYFNGSLLTTTNIALQTASAITGLRITDAPGSTYNQWICIGAWQHNGTPTLDDSDDLPNNGFMNGRLDNLRIYDRKLSDSEIQAIYTAEVGSVSAAPSYYVRKTTPITIRRR